MGAVCGSSQICRSKENGAISESNMQQKQKSLSDPKDDVFEHDKRRHRLEDNKIASSPSSQSLSNSDLMITPNPSANILNGSRQSKSKIKLKQDNSNSDGEEQDIGKSKKKPINLPSKAPSMGCKARVSRNISGSSISVSGISQEEIIIQPDMAQIKSRKSAKHCYFPLDDDEIDNDNKKENDNNNSIIIKSTDENKQNDDNDGAYTPTPLSYKASKANAMFNNDDNPNNKFVREKGNGGRRRASSQDIMTAAEYALMEDSATQKLEDFTGLVTPLATPSTNLHQNQSPFHKIPSHDMKSAKSNNSHSSIPSDAEDDGGLLSPQYQYDFADKTKPQHLSTKSLDSLSLNGNGNSGKMYRERGARRNAGGGSIVSGPMSNFNSNTASQSSITNTLNNNKKDGNNLQPSQNQMIQNAQHFDSNDNLNANHFYTTTREPNLSMSAIQPSLLQPNQPFPRVSSTSSDFAHLLEYGTHRKDSRTKENDDSDYIQWRFSQSGMNSKDLIGVQNIAGSSTSNLPSNYNSMSSIAIDRVSSRDHDL